MKNNYITDIGLEVHVELATRSKMFCSCAVVDPTIAPPNSAVCEVCCGMPGVLPMINKRAVELAIRAVLALNCEVAETSVFARKNYFYPDLPKGYQISQYEQPLAVNGHLTVQTSGGEKIFRIRRTHLEEDTGKLTHVTKDGESFSLVDLNRAGVPLLEIVSEPDMHSVEDVRAYSRELRLLLRWLDVTSGDMEKGTMRFEANVSLRPANSDELGTRVEIKNLNSFRAMEQAITYQLEAQCNLLDKGEKVAQQTLGWNESENRTFPQRSKEEANDYRYFPEPDLPPLIVDKDWLEEIRLKMPELPSEKRSLYQKEYGLNSEDIERLLEDKETAAFFESCVSAAPQLKPKNIVNWLLTDLFAWLNQNNAAITVLKISPQEFTRLVKLVEDGAVNQNTGKEVLAEMLDTGKGAKAIIKDKGLKQISDSDLITDMVSEVLKENQDEVQSYIEGKKTVANWLFGQVMKAAKGKANPQVVKAELNKQLNSLAKK